MLNAKALSDLFTKNSDERLCKRWFLMSRNGTLLAYTQSANIKDLRKQAAMATLSWQEHQDPPNSGAEDVLGEPAKIALPGVLHTLTVEAESSNLIIRKVQPQLLLVLEGGVPPRKQTFEPRATPETPQDAPYPSQEIQSSHADSAMGSSLPSTADSSNSTTSCELLALQRRKLDAMASAIGRDLESTGFKMPEEGNIKTF